MAGIVLDLSQENYIVCCKHERSWMKESIDEMKRFEKRKKKKKVKVPTHVKTCDDVYKIN